MIYKVTGNFKLGNKALSTEKCKSERATAMAMDAMLAAQLGKLGLAPDLLEVPNIVVEGLIFLQPRHYTKVFLDNEYRDLGLDSQEHWSGRPGRYWRAVCPYVASGRSQGSKEQVCRQQNGS